MHLNKLLPTNKNAFKKSLCKTFFLQGTKWEKTVKHMPTNKLESKIYHKKCITKQSIFEKKQNPKEL